MIIHFRTAVPYYNQLIKQEHDDDYEITWKSLSVTEKQSYNKMRKEVSQFIISYWKNESNRLISNYGRDETLVACSTETLGKEKHLPGVIENFFD